MTIVRPTRPWILAAFFFIAFIASRGCFAAETTDEYQKKAECLFNFAKFVQWPAHKFSQPDAPFILGVIGTDPFRGLLEEAVQDQRINDHVVVVKHITSMEEMRKCHLIFVSRSESARLGPILAQVRGENVLTVGETDKFLSRGGIINFVSIDNAVRFEISESAAHHAGLKISSRLMMLGIASR